MCTPQRQDSAYHSLWWTNLGTLVLTENSPNCKFIRHAGSISHAVGSKGLHELHPTPAVCKYVSLYICMSGCIYVWLAVSKTSHMYVFLAVPMSGCVYVCLALRVSSYLYVSLSVFLVACNFVYLYVCMYFWLNVFPSVCLALCMYIWLNICMSGCIHVCLAAYMYVWL